MKLQTRAALHTVAMLAGLFVLCFAILFVNSFDDEAAGIMIGCIWFGFFVWFTYRINLLHLQDKEHVKQLAERDTIEKATRGSE